MNKTIKLEEPLMLNDGQGTRISELELSPVSAGHYLKAKKFSMQEGMADDYHTITIGILMYKYNVIKSSAENISLPVLSDILEALTPFLLSSAQMARLKSGTT